VDHEQHEAVARWERRWLNAAGILLVVFIIFIAYSLATEGAHIAQRSARTTPEALANHELFANPGVRTTLVGAGVPSEVEVTLVTQTYAFSPSEILLPVGAVTTFYMTSRDTLHGFQVENTTINVELIPGEISTFTYTFDRPGEYRITCNEYCGLGHHAMMGTIRVLYPEEYAAATAGGTEGEAAGALALGEEVYAANCSSCHQADGQGLPGAFPPLAGHAVALLEADRSYLPRVLLYGLEGPITVGGSAYNGQMPTWSNLSDEELAGVLNYIVSAWGDELPEGSPPYTPEEVASLRGEGLSPQDVHAQRQALELGE